jgi:Zn-dependent protease with chaperone function
MDTGKRNEFVKLITFGNLFKNWVLACFMLIAQFFAPIAAPLFFIFTSNLFDIYGYYFVLRRLWNKSGANDYAFGYNVLLAYRIIQNLFDYLFLVLIWTLFGFKYAVASWVLKIFGLQDLLFYAFLDFKPPKVWTWLKWTPFGFIENLIRGKGLENWLVITQANIGVAIYILICYA